MSDLYVVNRRLSQTSSTNLHQPPPPEWSPPVAAPASVDAPGIWAMDFWQKQLATLPQRAALCCHWCRGPSRFLSHAGFSGEHTGNDMERLVSECLGIQNHFPKLWIKNHQLGPPNILTLDIFGPLGGALEGTSRHVLNSSNHRASRTKNHCASWMNRPWTRTVRSRAVGWSYRNSSSMTKLHSKSQ